MNKNPDISNLKPFKKGQSGNLKGRPKMPDLKEAMAATLGEEKDGKKAIEVILAAMRAKAAKGDVRAAEFLFDRGFGKATQDIHMKQEGTQQIEVIIKRKGE